MELEGFSSVMRNELFIFSVPNFTAHSKLLAENRSMMLPYLSHVFFLRDSPWVLLPGGISLWLCSIMISMHFGKSIVEKNFLQDLCKCTLYESVKKWNQDHRKKGQLSGDIAVKMFSETSRLENKKGRSSVSPHVWLPKNGGSEGRFVYSTSIEVEGSGQRSLVQVVSISGKGKVVVR